jgi:DNA repair exonuclease SbcCD ATPase subunit
MLDVLWLLAVAGACFGYLGWWWRGKLAVTMSLPEDLQEISELKERLLEYEIDSKNDKLADKRPVQTEPSKVEEDLQRRIAELTAALAETQLSSSRLDALPMVQAELNMARDALAAAEQRQAELSAELESVKKAHAKRPADPQGIFALDVPESTAETLPKKKRPGKKK